ncbi:MAG TPA: hypothetical protein VGN61_07890, partial [Verrucomicrobiae bacterium]
MKRLIAGGRVLLLVAGLFLFVSKSSGSTTLISDYKDLQTALKASNVVTNFTNATISLTTAGQTFQITKDVLIDGGTNNVVIDGGQSTRLFVVSPGATLTLNNLQLLDGIATTGGAIFNEGTLIISNCIISGNFTTNINGANGTTNSNGGDGGGAGNGGNAVGGAIYSTGSLRIYYSVLGTNGASGGAGGNGGPGGSGVIFAGNGGNGGNGGTAYGAAIYSTGPSNVFFSDMFVDNICTAAPGGSGGGSGSGAFAGSSGSGGTGGSAGGGAVYITGNLSMSNCLFYLNSASGGSSAGAPTDATGSGPNGNAGGTSLGGGLFMTGTGASAYIENTVFFDNRCIGGAGGNAAATGSTGGNGGSALGGGLYSVGVHAVLRSCTLATNILTAGTNGTGNGGSGSYGSTGGWDIYQASGSMTMSDSIVSGDTNQAPNYRPNLAGVADAGYNICSDATLARATSTTLINTDPGLDTGLSDQGTNLGPVGVSGPDMLTLALSVNGSVAEMFIPGVPGISFPALDQVLQPRGTPTSSGAYEEDEITLTTNATTTILTQPGDESVRLGQTATFSVDATNYFLTYTITTNTV